MYVIKLNDIFQFHFQVSSERYWIGLHDRKVKGNFHWMDGTQFDNNSFDSWGLNQPNNIASNFLITNADCCSMKSDRSWWDDDCETPQPFICEITLLCRHYTFKNIKTEFSHI